MKPLKTLFIVAIVGTVLAAEASVVRVCTRSDYNAIKSATNSLGRALRAFENSPIKSACPAGKRLIAASRNFTKVIKAHARCTLATSSDRRAWARIQSDVAKAERELRNACR